MAAYINFIMKMTMHTCFNNNYLYPLLVCIDIGNLYTCSAFLTNTIMIVIIFSVPLLVTRALVVLHNIGVRPSEVILTSNLNDGNIAYNDETVIFTCIIQGYGTILTWTSNEYIGQGHVLEFASVDSPGRTATGSVNPTTTATLIRATTNPDTGVTVIVSDLRITASVQYHVSCRINSHGRANTTTFQTILSMKIEHGIIIMAACIVWMPDNHIKHAVHACLAIINLQVINKVSLKL